jgi:antitoxin component of MazEF toxin-antitoxin module
MLLRIAKWGRSLAVRIPKSVAERAHPERLDDLIKRITPENIPGRIDWGPLVGCEKERHRRTLEGLADVDAGRAIDHRAVESGLALQTAKVRAKAWKKKNRKAIEAANEYVDKLGLPLVRLRGLEFMARQRGNRVSAAEALRAQAATFAQAQVGGAWPVLCLRIDRRADEKRRCSQSENSSCSQNENTLR